MMKRFAIVLSLFLCTFLFAAGSTPVYAKEVTEFTQEEIASIVSPFESSVPNGVVTHFVSEVSLNAKGDATIVENIVVYFPVQRHGIFRWIPNYVVLDTGSRLKQPISVTSVEYVKLPETATSRRISAYQETTEGAGYTVLKIGEADTYISGAYLYEITYTMKNAIRFQDTYQELYLNITGDQWELPILSAKATISPAKNVQDTRCYTGPTGSTETKCSYAQNGNQFVFLSSTEPGTNVFGMTVALKYSENTFSGPTALEKALSALITYFPVGLFLFAVWFAYSSWVTYGKDKRMSAIPPIFIPSKEILTENLSTLRSLLAMKPKKADILAEIITVAQKGFLTIRYEQKNVYLEITEKQKPALIEYLQTQPSHLQKLIETLTNNYAPSTNIKALTAVYSQMEQAHREADYLFTNSHLIDTTSTKKRTTFIILAVFAAIIAGASLFTLAEADPQRATVWTISGIGAAIAFGIAASGMLKRTKAGDSLYLELLGVKKYIKTAELKRLEFFNNPKRMIAHFEQLLPFAVILGLDKQWTSTFGQLLEQLNYAPTWIQSDVPLHSSLPHTYAAMANSMHSYVAKISTPPQSSGSSFSGGGGFSGGGSGGGGGGSW